MNNEIKEILDYLKEFIDEDRLEQINLNRWFISSLLDYITNLQEQLHQASLDIQELTERDIECPSWCDKLTNLQQENNNLKTSLDESQEVVIDLQQENERLKIDNKILKQNNINEVLRNDFDMCVKDLKKANKKIEKLEDYKSRIEKAVDYIKTQLDDFDKYFKNSDKRWKPVISYDYLLNILNGRSDE